MTLWQLCARLGGSGINWDLCQQLSYRPGPTLTSALPWTVVAWVEHWAQVFGIFLTIRGYDLVGNSPSELRALIREESVAHKAIAEKYKLGS